MSRGKKAEGFSTPEILVAVGILILVFFVIFLLVKSGFKLGSEATENVGKCGGMNDACCDVYFNFECPSETKMQTTSEDCPGPEVVEGMALPLSAMDLAKARGDAKARFATESEELKNYLEGIGIQPRADDYVPLKSEIFGRCCVGVVAPAQVR